jgi:hypothetical protein
VQSPDFSPQQFFEPRQSSSFVIFARDSGLSLF